MNKLTYWLKLRSRATTHVRRAPLTALGGLALTLATSLASAAPPATVVGSWMILADQTYTTLQITNQGGGGGPGGSACRVVLGSLGVSPINGYYCPETGRIVFLHRNPSTNVVVRTFTGSVSDATPDAPAHIAGTMDVLNVGLGQFGEYPFSGSKL